MNESVPASASTFAWITDVELVKGFNQIRLGATTLVFDDPDSQTLALADALAVAAVELAERIREQIGDAT